MIRRAIILVPGYQKRPHLSSRDLLVTALTHYAEGYRVTAGEPVTQGGLDVVRLDVADRASDHKVQLDIYESFWGDLVPDWSQESPWGRFKRGLALIWYWAGGGMLRALARREFPTRTVAAMLVAAAMLVLWYVTVISVLIQTLGSADSSVPTGLQSLIEGNRWAEAVVEWFRGLSSLPLVLFLIGLFGLGALEGMANLSSFIKSYLRDDAMPGDNVGIRARARQRLVAVLDHVNATDREYDDLHVVAHSLGGVIAVDALAEYGRDLPRMVLHTWGSPLGLLAQQDALVEQEIAKLYESATPLMAWIDVVFRRDLLASPRPLPRVYENGQRTKRQYAQRFAPTQEPPMPHSASMARAAIHDAYFRCDTSMRMLVAPVEALPAAPKPELPVSR